MITFDDVVKVYPGGSTAVDHVSLELPTGKMTVLVGPSGCGKTTSLRMINRMISPTSGRVLIDGDDIAGKDEALLRRGMGYVIQHAGLFPHRTVLDNVATVPVLLGKTRREARKAALGLLERVGLSEEFAKRYPAQLSGGQQQRVGVARALAADPPIMLMDEPFSAVDPVVREGLHREFLRLQQDLGKTIAMVTHDIDEAIKLGDVVAIFRQGGKLAQVGTPEELLTAPADDFVAEFVGRDRGIRSLSFTTAADLPVADLPGTLALDDAGRPTGWILESGRVAPTGGTFTSADSLRLVTDLAISSPVGIAVRVNEEGKADGVVPHHDLADYLAARRSS
ncbi:ABC transporter ATP-binding protein [Paractinoplanes brasiliensis]|uniref:ABC-type quaternary amine transporter n=1 Tax=Paractinoplanes brasiliensis TaxID=52695 RepID=A0A4R6JDH9_9ACTN|nr:ATP-binding cassette domain-containing protein [Actinoplanes brasiliensis]TDO32586.1 osmoprotectant transport system ATP-binding protein [Actinoplanes brasiliensis]GID27535.1 proline/glycine betaine ABC transporter ATP-binding protein [Actinoplanes brasiliensis]